MSSTAFRYFVCGAICSTFLLSFSPSTSADALDNWTTTQVSTNSFHLSSILYANGHYVAAGGKSDGGAIMTSEDGLDWTLRADGGCCGPPSLVWGLTYGGGRFVAVGHFGGTASSTNGINWSYGFIPTIGLYGVAYGAGKFVAVGSPIITVNGTNGIFYSTNGINWETAFQLPDGARVVRAVAYGAGKFVAVAEGAYTYTSQDGIVWFQSAFPGGTKIQYLNGKFFVPLGNGTNLLSLDGVNWAVLATGVPGTFGRLGYANGIYLAFTGVIQAYTNVVCSTDGTNWIQRSTRPFYSSEDGESSAFQIASDGRRFVAVGGTKVSPPFSFNAFVHHTETLVDIGITNSPPPQITLSGVVGRSYRIEYVPVLPTGVTNPWQTLTNLILPSSPCLLADPEAPNSAQRYYRALLLP